MNGTNDKKWQIQDCFSPGGGSAVKAVTKWSTSTTFRTCVEREVSEGGCVPWRAKNSILKLNSRDLVHTFWQHFTKKIFKVNYWIHYHVWRSSHFSCFDAFVSTFIFENLKSGCLRGNSEGEFPLQKLKKLQFSNSIRCIPFANILLKTIIYFR